MNISPALATALAEALNVKLSAGSVAFFGAPIPVDGAEITTQVSFGVVALAAPSGVVTGGRFELTLPDEVMALNNGTPLFARFANAQGAWLFDVECGAVGSGLPVIIDPLPVQAGGIMFITLSLGW